MGSILKRKNPLLPSRGRKEGFFPRPSRGGGSMSWEEKRGANSASLPLPDGTSRRGMSAACLSKEGERTCICWRQRKKTGDRVHGGEKKRKFGGRSLYRERAGASRRKRKALAVSLDDQLEKKRKINTHRPPSGGR